jgi:hypothetical protein
MRLLIIEDNIDFLIGLADFLQKQGFADELRERSEAITPKLDKDKGAYTPNKTTYSSMSLYFDDYETAEKALNEFMAKIDEEALNRN